MQQMRSFPWREENDPFHILIAEMMLIRTRADLVVPVYLQFIRQWPRPDDLVCAADEQIAQTLVPLGLPQRIPFFKQAAKHIIENHAGVVPSKRKDLEKIPGVGRYVAEAVLAFAFNQPIVPADVNVLRWISRITGLEMISSSKGSKEIRLLLPRLAPLGGRQAYKFLDFLREICRPRKPACDECWIQILCHYGRKALPDSTA
jgi:A/G-specific adenine glycosylase